MNSEPEVVEQNVSESIPSKRDRAHRRGFVMTAADLNILDFVFKHRLLHRDHLSILSERHPKRVHRRLCRLEENGYLKTIRLPQQKFVYSLGRAGVQALVEQGKAPDELLDERSRTHELSELFLKHEMMIADIHVRLSVADRQGPVSLVAWREGKELYDSVLVTDSKGSNRLPVRPDAFFSLLDSRRPDGANRASFCLEADRSTTTHSRFEEKLRAYRGYLEQGLCQKKLGVKGFRVLSVTLTDARAKHLVALAATVLPVAMRPYFMFTSNDRLVGSTKLYDDCLCWSAREPGNRLCALLPPYSAFLGEARSDLSL